MIKPTLAHFLVLGLLALQPTESIAGALDDDELLCNSPYFSAAQKNDVPRLKALLLQGINVNEKSSEGFTALICAADAGSTDAARLLIENGANPNNCTIDQNHCPLWFAAMKNAPQIVELLIDKGAKLEEINGWNGNTVLAWSVRTGKTDAARVLVRKGASLVPVIKKEYYGGKTALQLAKRDGHRAVVELIEAAANKPLEPMR